MTLTDIGNAAGGIAHDARGNRRREPFLSPLPVPAPAAPRSVAAPPAVALGDTAAEHLLEAVRRNLSPGDPVARLLAGWPAPPVRAVAVPRTRRRPGPA